MNASQEVGRGYINRALDFSVRDGLGVIARWFIRYGYWALCGFVALGGVVMVIVDLPRAKADGLIMFGYICWIVFGQFAVREFHRMGWFKTWREIATR